MPYRIDIGDVQDNSIVERLIELGALDVDVTNGRGLAVLMPDAVSAEDVARALGVERMSVSAAVGRDADSVWLLRPRPIDIGRVRIIPAEMDPEPGSLRLIDGPAFGTGLHPTTMLCLEILDEVTEAGAPATMLDVGTGSGVLALAALTLGVRCALGTDVDDEALKVAAENARVNGLSKRLELRRGGPDAVTGAWPLVVANILGASLVDMAPALVRRVGHDGRLILSGIPSSAVTEVVTVYRDLGMRHTGARSHGGWSAATLCAPW